MVVNVSAIKLQQLWLRGDSQSNPEAGVVGHPGGMGEGALAGHLQVPGSRQRWQAVCNYVRKLLDSRVEGLGSSAQ